MHRAAQKQTGFTIVELLIVIVVIGILAAITIVAYNGIQNRAKATAAQSAVSQAAKRVIAYSVENSDIYPVALSNASINDSGNTTYQYSVNNSTTPKTYCITATTSNISYYINNTTQTTPAAGGCPGHGQNGVAAITNMATDPEATSYATTAGQIGWRSTRWAGGSPAAATYSLVSGASDGPSGMTTYARKTWTTAPAAIGNTGDTGFDSSPSAFNVTEGKTYYISCFLRASVIRNFEIGVYQSTPAGAAFSPARSASGSVISAAGQWTRVSYAYTAPIGVGRIGPVCDSNSNSANGAVNWAVGSTLDGTGLMITEGNTLYNFADGASTNWAWSGAVNNSSSTGPPL
ncbi:MAG: prepilin-type N-terminal cleavage/methylation protein [Candidatus Saccharibacteria bacterium]|nr:prepilin-type N-terminal cleavage/methylation protein [Candidatus Saccharibacteria bacterium]